MRGREVGERLERKEMVGNLPLKGKREVRMSLT